MIVDVDIKNKSTSKVGMVVGKGTHKKGAMELKYLSDFKYNDKLTLKEVIETYEKALIQQNEDFNKKIDKMSSDFENALKTAKSELTTKEQEFEKRVKKILKETLEVMQYGL